MAETALGWRQLPAWVIAVILICCAIEAVIVVLTLAGFADARQAAFVYGGFWPQLLGGGWLPAYPGQSVAMFLTYGVLHGGLLHLAMNMLSLAVVAREMVRLIGAAWMAAIYLASQIGAALLFAAMAPESGPMVGASGAVFGLAGALVVLAALRLRQRGRALGPLWRAVFNLVALNVGLTFLVPSIAWQAHLGGAATGVVLALMVALTGTAKHPMAK